MPDFNALFNASSNNQLNGLALSNVTFHTNSDNIITATGIDASNNNLVITFSIQDGALVSNIGTNLGTLTLKQLSTQGYLPPSTYTSDGLPDITFTALKVSTDPNRRLLTITGIGPSSNVTLGVSALPLINTQLLLQWYVPLSGSATNINGYISGNVQIGGGLPVTVTLPKGAADWQISSQPNEQVALNAISDLDTAAGNALETMLPAQVPILSGFALNKLMGTFDSQRGVITTMGLEIGNTSPWILISPDVLVFKKLVIWLNGTITYNQQGTSAGLGISGHILGTITLFKVDVNAFVPIPPLSNIWTIDSSPNVELPGIGDIATGLANIVGVTDFSTVLPAGLDSLGSLLVEYVQIQFTPDNQTVTLNQVMVRAVSYTTWQLPVVNIAIENILIELTVTDPLGSHRQVVGILAGTLVINNIYIPIAIIRPTSADGWSLQITYADIEIGLPDLLTVVNIPADKFRASLPSSLSILSNLVLSSLNINYSLSLQQFVSASFTVTLLDTWTLIHGYLSVDEFDLSIDAFFHLDPDDSTVITAVIGFVVTIAGVSFNLGAANNVPNANWIFKAGLQENQQIDLNTLVAELITSTLLPSGFVLPSSFPHVVVTDASVMVTPATGEFSGSLTSTITWDIPFSQSTFQIEDLKTVVDIGAVPATGPRPYTFSATGNFKLATVAYLQGTATFTTSSGATPTIITVEVTATDQIQGADLVNALLAPTLNGQNSVKAWDSLPIPADYSKPNYIVQAGLQINLTDNTFLIHGAFTLPDANDPNLNMYGVVALLVVQQADKSYSYAVAAMLKTWSFAKISVALAVVDEILTVTEAAILLSNIDAQNVTPLVTYVPALGTTLGNQKGLNFYATLQFGDGLLAQIAQLIGITTQGPFTIKGYIAADSSQSVFEANLGGLTLLKILSFNNIVLKYTVQESTTFTLTGDIVVTVSSTNYTFKGDVSVVETKANAQLQQPATTTAMAHINSIQNIANPLGIPSLTLSALFFDFYYHFDGTQSDNQYALGGTVQFSDVVSMSGLIYFKNNAPAIVYIQLQDLNIGVFFQKLFNVSWSLLTFSLKNGMLYYAPNAISLTIYDQQSKTTNTLAFSKGFHASTDIDILFIKDFHIDIAVGDAGIVASGGYNTPIDWKFIQFYRAGDPTKGPMVAIDTTTTPSATFSLSGGFGLFGTPIASLLMSVQSKTINGLIALDQEIPIFGKPSFGFTWDDENGFHVAQWPLNNLKLPDFDFDFSNVKLNPECPLTGLIKIPITSKVDITPSFSIKMITPAGQTSASPFLVITINGALNLVVNSSAYPDALLSAPFVNASLQVPFPATGAFTWETLADSFIQCIQSAAVGVFDTLIKDPQNLAKLLAVEGLVWSANQLKDFLLCEWEGIATEAAITAFVEAASGAIATTIVGIVVGGAGIVVGGIVGFIDSFGNHHNDGGNDDHDNRPPRPNAPAAPKLSYSNGQLNVSWDKVDNAKQYSAVIAQDGKRFVQTNSTSDLFIPVPADDGHTYSAQIVARGDGGTSDAGPSTSLTVLAHPSLTDFYYDAGQVTTQWSTAISNGSGYTGQFVNESHQPFGQTPEASSTDPNATKLSASLPGNLPTGVFSMAVQAISNSTNPVAGNVVYPSTTIFNLSAPAITGLSFSNQQVIVTLQANPAQAVSYNTQFVDAINSQTKIGRLINISVPAPSTSPVPPTLIIQTADLPPTGTYKLQIQAVGTARNTIPSAWTISSTTVAIVGIIPLNTLLYADGNVIASWIENDAVQTYRFELRDAKNAVVLSGSVSKPDPQTPAPTSIKIAVPATLLGATYNGYLQVTANGLTGPWSAGLSVVLLDVPQNLKLSYTGASIHANWDPVTAATGYTVEITESASGQTHSASILPGKMPPDTMLPIAVDGLLMGLYTGVVKTLAGAQGELASVWSSPPVAFGLLPAPIIITINYAANFINLDWSSIAPADSYHISISDGIKTVATGKTSKNGEAPAPTHTSIDVTLLPRGLTYFAFVSAAIGNGVGASSESSPVMVMDVPGEIAVTLPDAGHLTVNWGRVEGATTYHFQILTDSGQLFTIDIPPVSATPNPIQTTTIDISTVPDGIYQIQVMAQNGSVHGAWSAGISFTVKHLTPDTLAAQLYANKVIAPSAAPQIVQVFPTQFSGNASALISLLQAHFPESTKSLTQLAWALAKGGYDINTATQVLSTMPNTTLIEVLAATKAAYPNPALQAQISQLVSANTPAPTAAQQLKADPSDLNALQMAVLLSIYFASGVETPADMAKALHQAGYDINATTGALTQTFPLNSLLDYIVAIRSIYPPPAPQ